MLDEDTNRIEVKPIIAVDEHDVLPRGHAKPPGAAKGAAPVRLVEHLDTRVMNIFHQDVVAVVGTAVVDTDDLDVRIRLLRQAVETLTDVGARVVDRDDETDERGEAWHVGHSF